jgi:hypothetical protein
MTSADATTSNVAVAERHGSRVGDLETEVREMLARVRDLLGRGIDAGERCRRAALRDQIAERAGAATDIEPACVAGGPSQPRNFSPIARLQRPMKRS